MVEKEGVKKYVSLIKKLFVAFSVVMIPAIMIFLVFALAGNLLFIILAPCSLVIYLVVYGFYALRVSMGTVIGYETTAEVVHLKTKRKTYTYDAKKGCVSVRATSSKFVCVFETQDSRDKYIFLRRTPFAKYGHEQFTEEDIRTFFPAFEGVSKTV